MTRITSATAGLEHQSVCSRRLFADFRRIASSLLLRIREYPSSSLLALLGTRRKYSVRKLIGALALVNLIAVLGVASCSSDPPRAKATGSVDGGESRGQGDSAPGPTTTPPEPVGDPDLFDANEVDVVSIVRTAEDRRPISPLIYGINTITTGTPLPTDVMAAISFVRRGGDRANAYNWETNVSNGAGENAWSNDLYLASGLSNPNAPAAVDLELIARNRAAGRGTMVPFVLNDHVSGPLGGNIPYDSPGGWNRDLYFKRVGLVKPTAFSTTPDLNDGLVYTDEHFHYMRSKLGQDIYAPGPSQVMVGIDNEPDLYAFNFPMLQVGGGAPLRAANGVQIGTRVTGTEFTAKFLVFAKRIKSLAPGAVIVGPSHYHFDGWTSWHSSMPEYTSRGKWYMDDFLAAVKTESEKVGKRLLDTWDFHWYPQTLSGGVFVWDLDDSVRPLTETEITRSSRARGATGTTNTTRTRGSRAIISSVPHGSSSASSSASTSRIRGHTSACPSISPAAAPTSRAASRSPTRSASSRGWGFTSRRCGRPAAGWSSPSERSRCFAMPTRRGFASRTPWSRSSIRRKSNVGLRWQRYRQARDDARHQQDQREPTCRSTRVSRREAHERRRLPDRRGSSAPASCRAREADQEERVCVRGAADERGDARLDGALNVTCSTTADPNSLSFVPKGTVDEAIEALVGYRDSVYVRIDTATGAVSTIGALKGGHASSGDIVSVTGGGTFLPSSGMAAATARSRSIRRPET